MCFSLCRNLLTISHIVITLSVPDISSGLLSLDNHLIIVVHYAKRQHIKLPETCKDKNTHKYALK